MGSNPGRRGGMPATNRLSYETPYKLLLRLVSETEQHIAASFKRNVRGAVEGVDILLRIDGR
jgi:hypothetical protein